MESGMYELFLLGKVMERPWHGYEIHQVLNSVVGPARQVSWGTIYPLLQRLEKGGLVQRVPEPSDKDDGRGRQRFAITAKGRQRFLQLMKAEARNDANYRETFRIKLGNFSRVDAETRRGILDRYLERLSSISAHTKAMSGLVSQVAEMGEVERRNILLALAHDRFLAESEAKWIHGKLQRFSIDHKGNAGLKE
jgi:DNA-binding PadR family transcriptional regulator